MMSLCRQISRVHKHFIGRGIESHPWQCSQHGIGTSPSVSTSALKQTMTAQKDETVQAKLKLKNRFLYASLCTITLEGIITREEVIQIYGFHQRGGRGRNTTARPHPDDDDEKGDSLKKWESWTNCNEMSQEEAQQKFIKMMNAIRARVGQPEI